MTGQSLHWKPFLLRVHEFDTLEVTHFRWKWILKIFFKELTQVKHSWDHHFVPWWKSGGHWVLSNTPTQKKSQHLLPEIWNSENEAAHVCAEGSVVFVTQNHDRFSKPWHCPWERFPDLWNLSGAAHPSLCSALGVVHLRHTLGGPQKGFEHFCHFLDL